MSKLTVRNFAISLDGFGAGPDQSMSEPLGVNGESLHDWMFETRMWHERIGKEGGSTGLDNDYMRRSFENVGAWIIGRNMFGPVRGPWPDDSWKGWWGKKPPYHVPVYVLTHHARESFEMEGGTTFHFVTDGIEAAWERAREAANGKDVRVGGGVGTIQQYLRARLIDDMHVAISPVLLGAGERLFDGVDLLKLGYECQKVESSGKVTHITIGRAKA